MPSAEVTRTSADASAVPHHPVAIVGAGPVGLATAIDLAQAGVPVVLLDDDTKLSEGSRAICFAKRTLEIFDRLGCGDAIADKGVSWHTGKVFLHDELVYSFDLLPEPGHRRPAFVNIQQYHVEAYLQERAAALPGLDIRWNSKVVGVAQDDTGVRVSVQTPDGRYDLACDYLVAADGARSAVRASMGLTSEGHRFRDRFLIADVRMQADFPAERWFWFDPPFHPGQSVLLHRQPDGIFRTDFQLGWHADPVEERKPETVIPRVRALLGPDVPFELVWVSIYTFSCQRMAKFRHARVLFAGDAAHGVSPFGARGANGGIQDADNLAWKLRLVLQGKAPDRLLDTYGEEREAAADENIRNSTRSTDFITPKNAASRVFRDAVLHLARDCPFARQMVNSGRLSVPAVYSGSTLNTLDEAEFGGAMEPGTACADGPLAGGDWLLPRLGGEFTILVFDNETSAGRHADAAEEIDSGLPLRVVLVDPAATLVWERYDAKPGTTYLIRPDQHVCARWRRFEPAKIRQALGTASCGREADEDDPHA